MPGIVNGHKIDLCKIYRTVIEECGIFHLSVTVLTVYGKADCSKSSGAITSPLFRHDCKSGMGRMPVYYSH